MGTQRRKGDRRGQRGKGDERGQRGKGDGCGQRGKGRGRIGARKMVKKWGTEGEEKVGGKGKSEEQSLRDR